MLDERVADICAERDRAAFSFWLGDCRSARMFDEKFWPYSLAGVPNSTAATAGCSHHAGMLIGAPAFPIEVSFVLAYIISRVSEKLPSWAAVPSRNPTLMTCQTAELARPKATE